MKQYTVTQDQMNTMRHALGWSKTPDLNKLGWRNYFSTGMINDNLDSLSEQGLMVRQGSCYFVTKEGARLLGIPEARITKLGKELPGV